jgi:hypothetical protein
VTPYVGVLMDGQALQHTFGTARGRFDQLLMRALHRTAELAASYAKLSTLYRSHTGALRSSITETVFGGMGGIAGAGADMAARVAATAPFAAFVENGTRPHVILPRRAKVLRFIQNGAVRFSRGVFHPGTEPRPFMAQARDRAEPLFERMLNEAFVRAFA